MKFLHSAFNQKLGSFLFILLLVLPGLASFRRPTRVEVQKLEREFQSSEKKLLPPVNYIRSRNIDVKHVSIDLNFDWANEQAFGKTTILLTPFHDLNKFTLDAALMTIASVKTPDGRSLKFTYDINKENDGLEIELERTYKPGEEITVTVEYRTNYVNKTEDNPGILGFGRGLRFIKPTAEEPKKPRQIWSQGETEFNRYWFPSYDSPNDFRTSELRATVEKPFMVISNGKLENVTDNTNGTKTFYWKMDQPYTNYLTSIVVGEYAEVKGDYAGIPVSSYVYKNEQEAGTATTKNLPATVKFFSEKTGLKYPYAKYAQTMVEDFGGGMENITSTTQITEMIYDERELLDTDSEGLQSHELAHQWFGNYVTCRDWGQIWLNESFATYLQATWDEELRGRDEFLYLDVKSNQDQYLETWKQGSRRPIVTKYFKDKDALFDNYAYPRGAAVLHMLRKHLGDAQFWKALGHYLKSNAHEPVSTEDFRIAVEETTGQSMDWFFDQWLYKMGHPIFEVTQNYDEATKKLTFNVKQVQQTDPNDDYPQAGFFQTYVEIAIDGKTEKVWIKPQAENSFTFDVAAKPRIVNFDVGSTLIKELRFEKSADELIYQMQNDKDVLGRNWAIRQFINKPIAVADKPKVKNAILETLVKDTFWHNRQEALTALREIIFGANSDVKSLDDATVQALQKATKDVKAPVRAAAISLLGELEDEKYAPLFLAALNDRSYAVIDEAAAALGATGSSRAYDALVKLTVTPSWHDRIAIAGFSGLGTLADKRAFERAYKIVIDKNNRPDLRTAALEVVGASGKGEARAYPLILESLKRSLENSSLQGTLNALQGLINIADPRGQEGFDLAKEKYKASANIMPVILQYEQAFKKALTEK